MFKRRKELQSLVNSSRKSLAEAEERVKIEVLGSYGTDGKIDINLLNNNLKAHIIGLTYKSII